MRGKKCSGSVESFCFTIFEQNEQLKDSKNQCFVFGLRDKSYDFIHVSLHYTSAADVWSGSQ